MPQVPRPISCLGLSTGAALRASVHPPNERSAPRAARWRHVPGRHRLGAERRAHRGAGDAGAAVAGLRGHCGAAVVDAAPAPVAGPRNKRKGRGGGCSCEVVCVKLEVRTPTW